MDCYQRKKQDVAKEFSSDLQNGLSEQQVNQNREKYGTNEFTKKKGDSFLKRFWDALSEPMVIILIVAAFITLGVNIVKAATGEPTEFVECVGIFLAILLSVSITLVMEGRSKKAFEALNKIKENILVKVVRGGKVTQIPQHDIVVGDIVIFETGDKIPVDCRVIETTGISVDESSLTGESLPVNKEDVVLEGEVPLAERVNMLYSGCYVGIGECRAIVTAVGDETEFGKIAAELGSAETTSTPIQEKLAHLGKTITIIGGSAAALIFLIQLVRLFLAGTVDFSSVADIFITSIVLIVASVPEGLPTIVAISLALNIIKMAKQNALVKKMVACETIGCINVICSDKTGTLTENRMTVMEVCQKGEMVKPEAISDKNLLLNFAINSTAQIEDGEFIGNPTECALLCAYGKTGQEKDYKTLRAEANVLHCYAFTSDTKNMTTVIKTETGNMAYSKGSPEKILSLCRAWTLRPKPRALPNTSSSACAFWPSATAR